jgi:hypothetical protein
MQAYRSPSAPVQPDPTIVAVIAHRDRGLAAVGDFLAKSAEDLLAARQVYDVKQAAFYLQMAAQYLEHAGVHLIGRGECPADLCLQLANAVLLEAGHPEPDGSDENAADVPAAETDVF